MDAGGSVTYPRIRQPEELVTDAEAMPRKTRRAVPSDASTLPVPTLISKTQLDTYAYLRFGEGAARPLVFLQHIRGTLDNRDPAVVDPRGSGREGILFESAGLGRSTGEVPDTIPAMASLPHAMLLTDPDAGTAHCSSTTAPSCSEQRCS
jgi:hypothetical protein